MKHAHKYFAIVGIVLFSYLIYRIGPMTIWSHIKETNPFYLFITTALLVPSILVRGLRWKLIIKSFGHHYSILKASSVFLVGLFFSELTPGRAGDAIRAVYLKKETHSFGKALSTVFVDRLADIIITFALAIYAVFSLSLVGSTALGGLITAAGLILVVPFVLLHEGLVRTIWRPVHTHLIPVRFKVVVAKAFDEFYHGVRSIKKDASTLTMVLVLTVVGWLLSILQGYYVAKAFGLSIPFSFLIGVIPLVTLVSVVPVTVSGLGTREAAFIFLFGIFAVASSVSVAYSLVYAFLTSWLVAIVGAVLWMIMPVKPTEAEKNIT